MIKLIGSDGLTYAMLPKGDCPHDGGRTAVTLRGLMPGITGRLKGTTCDDCGTFVVSRKVARKKKKVSG